MQQEGISVEQPASANTASITLCCSFQAEEGPLRFVRKIEKGRQRGETVHCNTTIPRPSQKLQTVKHLRKEEKWCSNTQMAR